MTEKKNEKKDIWDKVDIIGNLIGGIVLVAIPIVIAMGADTVARSLERGQLVDSLIEDLTDRRIRRDIALVALDAAIPPERTCTVLWVWDCGPDENKPDQVIDIALLILRDLEGESTSAAEVIKKRRPQAATEMIEAVLLEISHSETISSAELAGVDQDPSPPLDPQPDLQLSYSFSEAPLIDQERQRRSEAAGVKLELLTSLQQNKAEPAQELDGIRIVYIQYQQDRDKAEQLRTLLADRGVLAPGIEQVRGISQNDIRYGQDADRAAAEQLRSLLGDQDIEVAQLIDLSQAGYTIPMGQFEIWLKD